MKVCYTHFSPGAVVRERYQRGVDYLDHEFDLGFDDTLYLLQELKGDRNSLWVGSSECSLYFTFDTSEGTLWVDLDAMNGLWASSDVTLEAATEILRIVFEGGEFGDLVPTTDREWAAYSWGGENN